MRCASPHRSAHARTGHAGREGLPGHPTSSAQTVALVVGGMSERAQLDTIRRGARLIVATPGRLEDFLKRKLVRLDGRQDPGAGRGGSHARYGLRAGHSPHCVHDSQGAPDAVLLGHAGRRGQGSGAQLSQEPGSHRDRLDDEAGRERRTARLQRGCRQEAGASGALAERRARAASWSSCAPSTAPTG